MNWRKIEIMDALKRLENAKMHLNEGCPLTATVCINMAIRTIQSALSIAPSDAAINEVINTDTVG